MLINFISVLIPVYNAEKFLEKALDSVLNQSFQNFELLILNDGSTDRSAEIINDYALKDSRIIVVHQLNTGKSKALNKLVQISNADWCVFMDADDAMMHDRLEKQIQFHNANSDIMASSSHCIYIDGNGLQCGRQTYNGLKTKGDSIEAFEKKMSVICAWTAFMANKKIFLEIGGLRPEFWPGEDFDFVNRWIEKGNTLIIIQDYLMKYRIHENSVMMKSKFDFVKLGYCSYCQYLRVNGVCEISFEEYIAIQKNEPFFKRMRRKFHNYSKYYHKQAGVSYHQKKIPSFILKISIAILLDYRYVYASFQNQQNKVGQD